MTVIPHAQKARSTAESVVRVATESHLNQDLVHKVAGAIEEASLKGHMSCEIPFERQFEDDVQSIEEYLMLGMGYMCRRFDDKDGRFIVRVEW